MRSPEEYKYDPQTEKVSRRVQRHYDCILKHTPDELTTLSLAVFLVAPG
jgi:predicted glycosyltransferase